MQFEDDDYYYYVRAVPKIKVGLPQLNVRRVTEQSYFNASLENDEDFFDPGEMERKLMEKRTREAEEEAEEKRKMRRERIARFFSGNKKEVEESAEETEETEEIVIQDVMEENDTEDEEVNKTE